MSNITLSPEVASCSAKALNVASRRLLQDLNIILQTFNSSGLSPDWEGLAQMLGFTYVEIQTFKNTTDPVNHVIDVWSIRKESTIGALWENLIALEREDIVTDKLAMRMTNDARQYLQRQQDEQLTYEQHHPPLQDPAVTSHVGTELKISNTRNLLNESTYLSRCTVTEKKIMPNSCKQLRDRNIAILSLNNNRLLIGAVGSKELFIYSLNNGEQNTLSVADAVYDAIWSANNTIAYTAWYEGKVVIVADTGRRTLRVTQVSNARALYKSTSQNILFVTAPNKNTFKSIDGGVNWRPEFPSSADWSCWNLTEVSSNGTVFWAIETMRRGDGSSEGRIREFTKLQNGTTTSTSRPHEEWSCRNITLTDYDGQDICVTENCKLVWNGSNKVFLTDYINSAIHAIHVSNDRQYRYEGQLLTQSHGIKSPLSIAYDANSRMLYIGQEKGIVKAFNLNENSTR